MFDMFFEIIKSDREGEFEEEGLKIRWDDISYDNEEYLERYYLQRVLGNDRRKEVEEWVERKESEGDKNFNFRNSFNFEDWKAFESY